MELVSLTKNLGGSMERRCPVCEKRISEWSMASGKCSFVNQVMYHNACLQDVQIKDLPQKEP